MRLSFTLFVLGILSPGVGIAQEVQYVDLSSPNESLGHDLPSGSMIEAYSCVGPKESTPQKAGISLEWIETTDLYPRQRISAEFRVENIGTTPLNLPVHPTLTDLQPKDPATSFVYYRMRLPLEALITAEGWAVDAGGLELYGSLKRPDTFLTLQPGESIRVKGNVGVRRWYKLDQIMTLSTDLELSKFKLPVKKTKKFIPSKPQCYLEWSDRVTPLNAYMHADPSTAILPSTICTSISCVDKTVY
jgi:hypothetical protein